MTDTHDPTEVALRMAVRANPAAAMPRLVYADWLDEHDRPDLAAYVRLECEPDFAAVLPERVALCKRFGRNLGGWEFAEDVDRVTRKLDALRAADPTFALYGAGGNSGGGHRYRLDPPLSEPDLLRFEAALGFTLPAEYRAFVLRIGNGPAGPFNGLMPLDPTRGTESDSFRQPFPFTRADGEHGETAFREGLSDECLHFPEDEDAGGYFYLSDAGCGTYSFLVLNGDARGTVWGSGGMGELLIDRADDGRPHDFLTWYESWLDHGLRPESLRHAREQQARRR